MKIIRPQFCHPKWALCLCVLLLAAPCLHSRTKEATVLNEQKVGIQRLLDEGIFLEAIRNLENYLQQRPGDISARRQISKAYLEVEDYFRLRYHTGVILQELPEDAQALAWSEIADKIISVKYPTMVKDMLDALEENPENTVLRRELISLYMTGDEGGKAAEQFSILLNLQPDNEALWLDYARNLFWSDQLDKSLAAYEQYLAVAKEPKDVRLEIARVHAANKQFGTAVEQLRALIEDVPENHDARALLADIFRWNDDAMAAEEIYRDILAEDPGHGPSLRGLEELAQMAQRRVITTASMNVDAMKEKVEADPGNMDLVLQLARLYTTGNRYADAAETYGQYLEKRPKETPIRREYAFTLSIEERYDEAIQQLRIYLEEYPEDMTERIRIARMLIWQGKNEAAKRELLEMESIIPDNPELHWNLARIYEIEGDWARAISRYETLREFAPRFEVASAKIRAIESNPYYQIAMMERRIEDDPTDTSARLQLSRTFLDLERFFEAQEQAQAVLDYDPEHEQAQRIVGWAGLGVTKVRRERIEELQGILAEDPENFEAILEMARYYRDENDYPEALRYYFTYLNAFPQDREARLEYARVLSWEAGQRESAIREYAILIEDQPNNIDLRLTYFELLSGKGALTANDLVVMSEIEDILRERLFTNREDAEALLFMGRLYQLNSKWPEALDFYRSAIAANNRDQQQVTAVQERIESILALPDFQLAQLFTQVEENPSDVLPRLILARQLFDLKRYYESKEQATQVLVYDPDNVEASRIVGWSDIGIEEILYERIRTARSTIRENPDDLETALNLARLLKEAEIYPESLRYYYHYLKAYPGDVDAREEYAEVLSWEPTQLPNAVREFGLLAEMRPDDMALQLQYYELANRVGELSGRDLTILSAIEDRLRERVYFNDMDSEALFYLGRLHQIDENWNSALDYYEAAIAAGSQDATLQGRINTITATPDFQIASLEAKVANNPNNIDLRLSLIRQLLQYERFYRAQEQAEMVLEMTGRNREAREMYNYATQWIEGQQAEELQNLRLRVSQNPRDLEAQLELARILRNEGAFAEARQRYRLYLRAYPEDLEIRREYADTLAWSGENNDEAINEYRDLLFLYPNDRELKMQFARMLSWNPRYWNEAEEVLEELSIYEHQNPEILILKADIQRYRGRYGAAQRLYDQVLRMGPGVEGYRYDDRERRFIDERRYAVDRRNVDEARVISDRRSFDEPNSFDDRRFASEDFRTNVGIYEDSDISINNMPPRNIYRPSFDETSVRSYRDSLLDTNPNSPRNIIRYPQGSLSPQAEPDSSQSTDSQNLSKAHAANRLEHSSANKQNPEPVLESQPKVVTAQAESPSLALFTGKKIEWRRPEPGDYKVERAEMVLDPTDNNPVGARNYAQRPTDSLVSGERYEANRRGDSIRRNDQPIQPRIPENTFEDRPAITLESSTRPERYVPSERANTRTFFDDEPQTNNSRRQGERDPRNFTRPQVERTEVFSTRDRRAAEDARFSPMRTYTIPGDPQVRVEQPAPVYTRPQPVERPVYREPVYEARPEVIIQREIEYVPVPDRYVQLPRHNLDNRRIFNDTPIITRAPERRPEPRVFVPQYEPLPEPPRFYRENDRGLDTRIGTSLPSLPAPISNERRLFDDRLTGPTRYDFSRAPLEPAPVRYIRERAASPAIRDPYYEYRSTLPPPTRFDSRYDSSREPRADSMFREPEPRRFNNIPDVNMERSSRFLEADPRANNSRIPDVNTGRRSRLLETEPIRERGIREPIRERDLRNSLPPARSDGLPYYYNSTEDDFLTPKYSSVDPVDFKRAQFQPQSNLFIQPNDRDRRQSRDFVRPEDRQIVGQRNRDYSSLQPRGYARPDERDFVRPRSYTLPAESQTVRSRGDIRELPRSQGPARSYTLPAERQMVQPRTYVREGVRNEAPAPSYILPRERQPIQPGSYQREVDRQPAQAPTQPLRFEGSSSTINRLPYEERGRTYLPPERTPISTPPQVQSLPRQTNTFNRDILGQPRAVPASQSTTFGRISPTVAARAPLPARTVERIQGFPQTTDSAFNSDAYTRAMRGKTAIFDQLRPELMVDFGYENDTDGFSATHIGGRYNHFTPVGNLYYLGLSLDNYSEDDLAPIESVDVKSLLFGASGFMNEELRGFADFMLSDYSDGPDTSLSITAGGSYNFDGVNTLTASYSRFDFFREAKTVRSLLQEITADRFRVDWTSNPIEEAEGRPFGERVYFEGSLAYTNLSDDNSSLAYSLRPYYRIADNPNIDVSVGWQGLSYANQSLFYYSPENSQGPSLGARISGQTLWGLIYDVRGLVTFPTEESSTRSLLFNLRKDFTNHFSAGANIFLTEAPRPADEDYRFGSLLFDLRYQF